MRVVHLTLGLVLAVTASHAPRAASPLVVVESFYSSGQPASRFHTWEGRRTGLAETWWPNGTRRSAIAYFDDVFHGEYLTWSQTGRPYERKQFAHGRESGLQQAWDERGVLYLNYEVRNGRRFGLANAKPCLPAAADGTSDRGIS